MALTITGDEGRVRWGYYDAATLSAWTVSQGEGRRTLTAQVVGVDTYRVSQRPLVFTARAGRWPITELQITGASLAAVLGPKE